MAIVILDGPIGTELAARGVGVTPAARRVLMREHPAVGMCVSRHEHQEQRQEQRCDSKQVAAGGMRGQPTAARTVHWFAPFAVRGRSRQLLRGVFHRRPT